MDTGLVQGPTMHTGVAVAIDPVALVVTECITVTSAMRKHTRWAHSSVAAILGGGAQSSKFDGALRQPAGKAVPGKDGDGRSAHTRASSIAENSDVGLAGRWGLRGKKGHSLQDNPLLAAFARLRSDLKRCKDIQSVDAPSILHPFLQVIRSSSTTAPITSLALIAITKFFQYGIISRTSVQLPLAMQRLSSAVTHCRFEASDSANDEVVLFRILKLMEWMITGSGGEVLGDDSMCEMMETGISMCCQTRLSELLRRSAEVSMVTMCQTIFQRLKQMEVTPEELEANPMRNGSVVEVDGVKMDPTITGNLIADKTDTSEQASGRPSDSLDVPAQEKEGSEDSRSLGETNPREHPAADASQTELAKPEEKDEEAAEIKHYGLPSIRELFRVLVDLLDPHDKQHNDTMRVMALRIVDVALEVAGPSIASHPSLAALAKDTLCRHLFQLVRSENIAILNESLRVAGTLLSTCRRVLKLQQELYLSYLVACLHPRVEIPQETGINPALYAGVPQAPRLAKAAPSQASSGRSTPVPIKDRQRLGLEGGVRKPDAREAMVEGVGGLVRLPSFMAELFVNYDCNIDMSDLCQDMVGLLSRNAFPDAATWSTTNVPPLCLDALLGYIQSIAERLDDEPEKEGYPDLTRLREQRAHKRVVVKGASRFNENPKGGVAFLASNGIIDNPDDPASIARFLRATTRLDKKVIGDYISKKANEALLSAFMDTFDFEGLRIDEALRLLLNSFRLPGEAPLIDRIVNTFAGRYLSTAKPDGITDNDSIYVLTYAVIMLNTDQHNPNVKSQNRMTLHDFSRNLRGQNGKSDFEPEFLEAVYNSIKSREIILAEEHDNKFSFDHAWKELLFKIQTVSDLEIIDTNYFDADMFAATWKPVVATLSYVFMSATDDTVFSRVVSGYYQCAQIAAKYGIYDCLDHIVFCLSSISSLATDTPPSTSLNTEVQSGERKVMVSETAVRFGRDFKAQLATVVLFRVVVGHEGAIRDGWNHLVPLVLNLFVNSLITDAYALISSHADLHPIPLQSPAQVIDRDRASEGGLFSALTSYVSSFANDEPPEPSEHEIEYTLCTVDCISACSFDQLFTNISQLPIDSLKSFVHTLITRLPEDSSPRVMVVKPDLPAPKPVRVNGDKGGKVGIAYDPTLVFILEFATILAARDSETISSIGKEVADALQSYVRDASSLHPVALTRIVYYLLSFLRASHEHDYVRVPVVLHSISKLESEVLRQSAPLILKGLSLCLNGAPGLRKEIVTSPDFWSILKMLFTIPQAAQPVFDILVSISESGSNAITADNYEAAFGLLSEYATTIGNETQAEKKREETPSKRRPAKPVKEKEEKSTEGIQRGAKAMQLIYQITTRTPTLIQQSQLEQEEAWSAYWSPPFRALTMHSVNPCRPIRQQALSSLQRVLLSSSLETDNGKDLSRVTTLFADVLFPLMNQLMKPEVWHSDPGGMGETRLQAALLCCKVFLRFLDPLLGPPPGATAESIDGEVGLKLWSQILEILERLVKSGGQIDGLDEAVPETLKNIFLVMASGNYINPTYPDGDVSQLQNQVWETSHVKLERFLPGLMKDLFPDGKKPQPKKAPEDTKEKEAEVEEEVPAEEAEAENAPDTEQTDGKKEEEEEDNNSKADEQAE